MNIEYKNIELDKKRINGLASKVALMLEDEGVEGSEALAVLGCTSVFEMFYLATLKHVSPSEFYVLYNKILNTFYDESCGKLLKLENKQNNKKGGEEQ